MRNASISRLFRVLSVSLLLVVGMPLVGCDQAGQNTEEDDPESGSDDGATSNDVEDLVNDLDGTTRILADNSGYRADYSNSFTLYYESLPSDSEVLHACTDTDGDNKFDTYTKEENTIRSASLNDSGNLITTREITKAEGQTYSDEGQIDVVEYLDISATSGASTFKVVSSSEGYEGNFVVTASTNGVPKNASDCKNLDQFNKDVSTSRPSGTWRLLTSSDGNFDTREDDSYSLFVDINTDGAVLHSCVDNDGDESAETHVKEENSLEGTSQSPAGNTVATEKVTKAKDVIYFSGSSGKTAEVEYLSTNGDIYWQWLRSSQHSGLQGNVDAFEKTSGVPTSDQQCQNRDQFIQ